MKFKANDFPWLFSVLGLILSLGAPLGYYVHSYLFQNHPSVNFTNHISWVHQNDFHTVLYIGLGTNIFFSFFGYLIGRFAQRLSQKEMKLKENEIYNRQLKKHKTELTKNLINKVKNPTTLSLESLYYLQNSNVSENEKQNIVHSLIQELKKINHTLSFYSDIDNGDQKLSSDHVKQIIIESSKSFNKLQFPFNNKRYSSLYDIAISEMNFKFIIGQIFDSFHQLEIYPQNVEVHFFEGHYFYDLVGNQPGLDDFMKNHHVSSLIEFKFEQVQYETHEINPLLEELVERNNGLFFKKSQSYFIILPAQKIQKQEEAA